MYIVFKIWFFFQRLFFDIKVFDVKGKDLFVVDIFFNVIKYLKDYMLNEYKIW